MACDKNIILLLLIVICTASLMIISSNLDISGFTNPTNSSATIPTTTSPVKTYFGIMQKKTEMDNPTKLNLVAKEESNGATSYYTGIGELLVPVFKDGINCSYGPGCGKLKVGDTLIIPNNVDYTPVYQYGEYVITQLDH